MTLPCSAAHVTKVESSASCPRGSEIKSKSKKRTVSINSETTLESSTTGPRSSLIRTPHRESSRWSEKNTSSNRRGSTVSSPTLTLRRRWPLKLLKCNSQFKQWKTLSESRKRRTKGVNSFSRRRLQRVSTTVGKKKSTARTLRDRSYTMT